LQNDAFTINLASALGRVFVVQLTTLISSFDFTGATVAQFLYAHMIYIISKKMWLSVFIVSVRDNIRFTLSISN
jgi:hypothetical protein